MNGSPYEVFKFAHNLRLKLFREHLGLPQPPHSIHSSTSIAEKREAEKREASLLRGPSGKF